MAIVNHHIPVEACCGLKNTSVYDKLNALILQVTGINYFIIITRCSWYFQSENLIESILFIISEINQDPTKEDEYLSNKRTSLIKTIFPQLKEEIKNGNVAPIKPEHFLANLMSMCSYPLVAKPILQRMFGLDDDGYKTFLRERKKIIYKTLFNEEPE